MPRLIWPPLLALFVGVATANAKVTAPVTLEQILDGQSMIFTAKIVEFLPDKPGMVLAPVDKLKGEFPFDRIPVNLTGDKEAKDEKQLEKLIERLDKDVVLIIFANRRGGAFPNSIAYTNGTWLRLNGRIEKDGDKEVTRWQFLHCETYFRRTYKGTTEELIKVIQDGLKGGKLPGYNEKEEPGYGPPLKRTKETAPKKMPLAFREPDAAESEAKRGRREGELVEADRVLTSLRAPRSTSTGSPSLPFAVIQLPFLGLIAALAALFPALFGGMAVMMRRWVAALSTASFVSIIAALANYFPHWIAWSGIKSLGAAWIVGGVLAGISGLWAGYRYRKAIREGRGDEYQPRFLDRIGISILIVLAAGGLTYAILAHGSLRDSPWLELVVFLVPAIACLYYIVAHFLRTTTDPKPVPISAETVGLFAGCFACCLAGVILMGGSRGPAMVQGGGSGSLRLVEQPLWIFEPKEKGAIYANPCITPERIFVTVHHRQGFDQYGRVYALEPDTGNIIWQFDDDNNLKPLFCAPTHADGKLYFGEGYHTDRDSKLFCVDAATGMKVWDFATTSHTESTPAVANGKVVFGAGDDGMYCLDANSGAKIWQFPVDGSLHIDSNPLIHEGRVYGGSGHSKKSKNARIFCLDLNTGKELWGEKVEYAAWGSPTAVGKHVYFATGNGTFSEDRAPIAGLVLCREAASGGPVWERALPNSVVCRPAVDRYQVYVGCRDGNCYALDRHTGEIVWSKMEHSPILASIAVDTHPQSRTGEVVYAVGSTGQFEALSPADGSLVWGISFRDLLQVGHVDTMATPVVVREMRDGKLARRVYVGLGFGPTAAATPTARLYCFLNTSE